MFGAHVRALRSAARAMLMDHGTVWWSTTNGYGLTWLSVRLIEQGIRLRYGRVHHPQTQGKVERFHRTLDEAIRHRGKPKQLAGWPEALEEFRQVYNQRRPHEALGMQRPAERYRASVRGYRAAPRGVGISQRELAAAAECCGMFDWEGRHGSSAKRWPAGGCASRRSKICCW